MGSDMSMADEHVMSLQPGAVIAGRYEVVKCLGAGSMGLVYACRHRELAGHIVAVKVLFPEVAQDKTAAARFRNEIFASYRVSHPNVVRAYEYLRDGDIVAYTMEYVAGGDLAERLGRGGELVSIEQAIRILAQMCSGVQAIHDAGIVHRDLKPENIFLTKDGQVKIGDFGIARTGHGPKLTEHGGVVGTIDYVSPEYMLNSHVDWRSDIYAIGILGYEMLTGQSPFRGDSVYATMTKRLKSDPKPPSALRAECSVELDRIILRAMARDPEQRYQSAAEMFGDLGALLPEGVVGAAHLQVQRRGEKYVGPTLERSDVEEGDEPGADVSSTSAGEPFERSPGRTRAQAGGASGGRTSASSPERQPTSAGAPFSAAAPAQAARVNSARTSPPRDDYTVAYGISGRSGLQETQVMPIDSVTATEDRDFEVDTLQQPVRMEPLLDHKALASDGWGRGGPLAVKPVTLGNGAIDDVRLRRLSEVVDRMNRSIWLDVVTLVLIVVIGVAAGYLLLHVLLPDSRSAPVGGVENSVSRDLYE